MFRVALATFCSLFSSYPFAHASEINVSGSTSVARIMDVIAEEYNASHKDTYIAVQGVGSTAGIIAKERRCRRSDEFSLPDGR